MSSRTGAGSKEFHHPVVGDLSLRFEALEIAGSTGLTMTGYTAEPASPSHEALQLLSSWVATQQAAAPTGKTAAAE